MKVTISVRTYNRPELLKEALLSIYLQSYTDWEVILFDDRGDIDNFKVYQQFNVLAKNHRVQYITTQQPKDLFKRSWVDAVSLASGELVIRLDDDDLLHPEALSYIVNLYIKYPSLDFTMGSSASFTEDYKLKDISNLSSPSYTYTTRAWNPYIYQEGISKHNKRVYFNRYYTQPRPYTSIIHLSRFNIKSVWPLHSLRVSTVKPKLENVTISADLGEDLEFCGRLDYLGLKYTVLNTVLYFDRTGHHIKSHRFPEEIKKVRDRVDMYRPTGFQSHDIRIEEDELSEWDTVKADFQKLISDIQTQKNKWF